MTTEEVVDVAPVLLAAKRSPLVLSSCRSPTPRRIAVEVVVGGVVPDLSGRPITCLPAVWSRPMLL